MKYRNIYTDEVHNKYEWIEIIRKDDFYFGDPDIELQDMINRGTLVEA